MYALKIELKTEDREFIERILKALFNSCSNSKDLKVETQPETGTVNIKNNDQNLKDEIISLLRQNFSTHEVAQKLGLKRSTVAAYKAHLTMGHYQ